MPSSTREVIWAKHEHERKETGYRTRGGDRGSGSALRGCRMPALVPLIRSVERVREREEEENEKRVVHRKRPNDMADEAAGFGERAAPAAVR